MLKIDKTIYDICNNISANINKLSDHSGLLAQNILGQLRNLVESIISKVYIERNKLGDVEIDYYVTINSGLKLVKSDSKYKILSDFHKSLKITTSHYTLDENNSERLLVKYLEYIIKTREFLKKQFELNVLNNLDKFPLDKNKDLYNFYYEIAKKIDSSMMSNKDFDYDDRYYIRKKKPFFINGHVYYEITVVEANDKFSKFDRIILYTKIDINPYYAIKINIHKESINCNGITIPIIIVNDFEVAIRPCEIDNYAKILGLHTKTNAGNKDYYYLTTFLKVNNYSICDIVDFDTSTYNSLISRIEEKSKSKSIINILNRSRDIIINNAKGSNILKYLLLNLNNRIIKSQSHYNNRLVNCNENLSDLYLHNGCIPFDQMPFCSSPIGNNPSLYELFEILDSTDREHELLVRFIKNKAEKERRIYIKISELSQFNDIDNLISIYNNKLYNNYNHQQRKIEKYKDYVYLLSFDTNISYILKKLIDLSSSGIENYMNSFESWQKSQDYIIDCEEKQNAILNAFSLSKVFVVYGAAGTGKTTMLNHFANFFYNKKKVFLSNTYSSLENLKRRIKVGQSNFFSVKKYLYNPDKNTDILFIDECSTIDNEDMKKILDESDYKLLILAGDVYQIESINFGNWFEILKNFIHKDSYIDLKVPFRTKNNELINLWEKVRNQDACILEYLLKGDHCYPIDNSILDSTCDNEIILCLNYDGLYGINNVNRLLQQKKDKKSFFVGLNEYKIDDPILFNENCDMYEPLLYNNAKGIIHNIFDDVKDITFQIELDKSINELDLVNGIELVGSSANNNSIIQIKVNKHINSDDDNSVSLVPFHVAYAVSIHKSQGLEYDSVKIIIIDEMEEMITHNVFYTAITRTKDKLKIYWSPNTQNKVLSSFYRNDIFRDSYILSNKHNIRIKNND